MDPVVRIRGVGAGGRDLVLPANLTAEDRQISFTTPEQSTALPAGSFVIELSLNGGADFSGSADGSEQVLLRNLASGLGAYSRSGAMLLGATPSLGLVLGF